MVLDINRANNMAVSTTPLRVSTQLLSLGTPMTATISNGQDLYYMLDLTSAPDVQITGTYQVAGEASLFVRYAAIPDSSDFDEAATNPSAASPTINLAQPQGGNYYILIQGQPGAGSGLSFTLGAIVSPFAIDSIGPEQGSNAGNATLTVTGAEYTSQTVVQLNGPGGTVVASTVQFKNRHDPICDLQPHGASTGKLRSPGHRPWQPSSDRSRVPSRSSAATRARFKPTSPLMLHSTLPDWHHRHGLLRQHRRYRYSGATADGRGHQRSPGICRSTGFCG